MWKNTDVLRNGGIPGHLQGNRASGAQLLEYSHFCFSAPAFFLLILTAHLVAEGCQIWGRFLPNGPDLRGWNQSEDVLDSGGGIGPELIPEGIVWGFHELQDIREARGWMTWSSSSQTTAAKNKLEIPAGAEFYFYQAGNTSLSFNQNMVVVNQLLLPSLNTTFWWFICSWIDLMQVEPDR